MLPDFPKVKRLAQQRLLAWAKQQVPVIAPLLAEPKHYVQHEGGSSHLTRHDSSTAAVNMKRFSASLLLTHDEMKTFDIAVLHNKLLGLAEQLAEDQTRTLLQIVAEAAEGVGNTINARGEEFNQDHLLRLLGTIEMDFDPETEKPTPGLSFVMHPDTAAKLIPRIKEWESDPVFTKRYNDVMDEQRASWRDRENNRALVD